MTHDDYLWDRSGPPDDDTRRLEELLGQYRYRPPHKPAWRRPVTWLVVPLAAAAVLVLSFVIQHGSDESRSTPWTVSAAFGAPTLDDMPIGDDSRLSDGQWLATDGSSRLRVDIGGHGEIFLEPRSRLHIVSTQAGQHQMELTEGMLHAALWSPDDVIIGSPSADAIERDGEFVMAVDDEGRVCLSVNVGRVTLRDGTQESIVPAGAVCEAYPESGPGTPFCESAPDQFRLALESYDLSNQKSSRLEAVLGQAGTCDLVPLWHLLQRVDPQQRGRIFDHMAQLQPPPDNVTRAGIIALEEAMLEHWWVTIRHHHSCLICTETSGVNGAGGNTL